MFRETLRQRLIRYRHVTKHFVLYHLLDRKWLKETKKMHGKFKGQKCFIFATGPSINLMDLSKVEKKIAEGWKVIGINSFIVDKRFSHIKPDFMVISDPLYLNDYINREKGSKFWEEHSGHMMALDAHPKFTLFMPHLWRKKIDDHGFFRHHERRYFYHCENIEGALNGCDLLKPRYYIAMTAYIGIAIAAYLGFDEVHLFGFDEDYIKDLHIDINNHLLIQERHCYEKPKERVNRNRTLDLGQTLEGFCENVVKSCVSQRKICEDALSIGTRVINCNPESYVTGFPKTDVYLKK